MPWSSITPGRTLILLGNAFYAIGSFVADFNETHVYNPRWPPHARFHNGQTMTLSVLLAGFSTYYLLRPATSAAEARQNVFVAALVGSFYCVAGISAALYPGAHWWDPEYAREGPVHQGHLFGVVVGLMALGYGLEVGRLGKGKVA